MAAATAGLWLCGVTIGKLLLHSILNNAGHGFRTSLCPFPRSRVNDIAHLALKYMRFIVTKYQEYQDERKSTAWPSHTASRIQAMQVLSFDRGDSTR
ncbi:hypothetical protein BKA63DRAFT_239264 [Paraphoma chrysanthemicola]|nr:hypothetical protein BKA63DRAFT_239264 [Paraphoma chrysanthemicola]